MKTHDSKPRLRLSWLAVALLVICANVKSADSPATLKSAFKDHFMIGTALNDRQFTERDPNAAAFVKLQFNAIAPENALKWGSLHPRSGPEGYEFGAADRYVEFGEKNGMYIVGHCLVWHSQTPNWVFTGTNPPPANAAVNFAANTNSFGTNRFGRRFGPGFG